MVLIDSLAVAWGSTSKLIWLLTIRVLNLGDLLVNLFKILFDFLLQLQLLHLLLLLLSLFDLVLLIDLFLELNLHFSFLLLSAHFDHIFLITSCKDTIFLQISIKSSFLYPASCHDLWEVLLGL